MALEKFLRGIVLTGVFALPFIALYVANSMFFPFISGKNFAFRIIVEIVSGAWIALALIRSEYRPRRSWLLWAFAAFVVIIGLADALGVYPTKSFWSNYERMEGWVTLAHLFAYFVVSVSILNTEKLWRAWWHVSLAVSVIVGFIGVAQLLDFLGTNQSATRIDARLGNSTYAGVYMMFHIFIAALFLARVWAEKQKDRAFYTWLYLCIIALDTLILFYTATRGAILGLVGGAALSALILVLLAPRSRVAWRAGVGITVLIALSIGVFLARDTVFVRSIEPLKRVTNIIEEGYPIARRLNVGMAWQGFKERPLLGWGQENYAVVFDKYHDPRMFEQEQWFDRTHNVVFDWLIAGGILGLLAYLSLHIFALMMVWRGSAFAPYEKAILTGFFAGYFFYLIFTFDNITSYLLFVSLLAYITVRAHAGMPRDTSTGPIEPKILPILAATVLVGTWSLAWYVNASSIASNKMLIQAISPQGNPAKNIELFKEALAYPRGGHQEIREQLSQAAIGVASAEGIPNDVKQQFVVLAKNEMEKQEAESPLNARAPFFLGVLLDRVGAYPEASTALGRARTLSPNKQGILVESGLNAFARSANDEAIGYFKQAYELAPQFVSLRVQYATALIRAQRYAEAEQLINDIPASATLNMESRVSIAAAYYSAGNKTQAIAVLEKMKRELPESAAQADALIQQVRGGAVQ